MKNTGIIKKRSKISAGNVFLGRRGLEFLVSKAKSLEACLPLQDKCSFRLEMRTIALLTTRFSRPLICLALSRCV